MLAEERDFLNYLKTPDFEKAGEFEVPVMKSVQLDLSKVDLIGFNYCTQAQFKDVANNNVGKKYFVHTFLPDTYIERIWKNPNYYLSVFRRFAGIVQPDFSEYTQMPKAMKVFQHYRRQWVGAWMQMNGVVVIPAPCWSDEESFEYCFDGMPKNSCLCISSVGCLRSVESRKLFLAGLQKCIKVLEPSQLLWYGAISDECLKILGNIPMKQILSEQRQKVSGKKMEKVLDEQNKMLYNDNAMQA